MRVAGGGFGVLDVSLCFWYWLVDSARWLLYFGVWICASFGVWVL